jgi:hypothetical protein
LRHRGNESVKQPIPKEIRTYAVASTGEQTQPEGTAGQSGDSQGLSDVAQAGFESVAELIG